MIQTNRVVGEAAHQLPHGIDGIAGAERGLDAAGDDAAAVADPRGAGQTIGERRHAVGRFQRIAGGDQQPDLIQPQAPHGQFRDMAMAFVRGIERSAEQSDSHPPPVAEFRDRVGWIGRRDVVLVSGAGFAWGPMPCGLERQSRG